VAENTGKENSIVRFTDPSVLGTINVMGLRAAKFRDDDSARRYVERILWPSDPVCPHCGENEKFYKLVSRSESMHRLGTGVYKCARCRSRFSVTSNTIFAGSHIALHKWLLAGQLICATKDGISALRLQQELQLGSYRSAWFMSRRIRWALDRIPPGSRGENVIAALLRVKPVSGMPRPGTRRQRSVWAQVDEELHGAQGNKTKKGRATVDPRSAPR
jgi:transposase-like protein